MDIIQTFYDSMAASYDKLFEDGDTLQISKFPCQYRATRRSELTELLAAGCRQVRWLMPEESGFYQPIVVARK